MTNMHDSPGSRYPFKAVLPAPLYWIYRAFRTLMVGLHFAWFWSGCVVVGWLWLPIIGLWPGSREVKMRRAQRVMQSGFRLFHASMRVMRLYRCTTTAGAARPPGVRADTPAVLVANHPTLCDTTSIVSLFPGVVTVAKVGYSSNPLVGRPLRTCGFVPVGTHMIQECEDRLRMGFDLLVFPEGTRSPVGGLQPFHRGAFEIAVRAKVPIVLLKVTCVPSALSKRLPIWKHPDRTAVLTIEPIEMIQPADSGLDSRALARVIEQRFHELLGYSAATSETVKGVP
jgi:1-acyl-sn-glycerol-3-phosphate acyltransferase